MLALCAKMQSLTDNGKVAQFRCQVFQFRGDQAGHRSTVTPVSCRPATARGDRLAEVRSGQRGRGRAVLPRVSVSALCLHVSWTNIRTCLVIILMFSLHYCLYIHNSAFCFYIHTKPETEYMSDAFCRSSDGNGQRIHSVPQGRPASDRTLHSESSFPRFWRYITHFLFTSPSIAIYRLSL